MYIRSYVFLRAMVEKKGYCDFKMCELLNEFFFVV